MKKTIVFLIIYAVSCLVGRGEEKKISSVITTGGLKAEANLSGFFVNIKPLKSTMNIGGTFGGFVHINFTKGFSLQPELLFHFKESSLDRDSATTIKGTYQYWGCEIPIYFMYHFNLPHHQRLYVGLGPYTEFGFSAILKRPKGKLDLYLKEEETGLSRLTDNNSGIGVIVGYEFSFGLQINATYKASFTNVQDRNKNDVSMYPYALSLGIAYRFHQINQLIQDIKNAEE